MEKLVYVLWRRGDLSPDDFVAAMRGGTAPRLVLAGARGVSFQLVDSEARGCASVRITRLDPPPDGTASFWLDCADDRAPLEEALGAATERLAGYLVAESVPLHNTTHRAPLGARTPGTTLVALLERPERLSWAEWLRIWHEEHRKVALETQNTHAYVRNVVVRSLTADAPPWAGIVEESFATEAVTDPLLWYRTGGSKERLGELLGRMLESVRSFLDIERVESHPMSEYRIGGPADPA